MRFDQIDYSELVANMGEQPVPIAPYTSDAAYESEIENIFKKAWLKVGLEQEMPKVGDWKVKELEFANTSVILIRGKDQKIRAFHNMCSHRGNKVIPNEGYEMFGGRKAALLTCRFHGWVFDAEGQIVSVPEEDHFPSCFQKEENGLTAIHCDVWNGLVFINLDKGIPATLADYLGDYGHHFDGFPFDKLTQSFNYHTVLNTNWKVGMDAFAEAYHAQTLHAGSLGNINHAGVGGVRFYGPHKTCSVHFDMQPSHPPVAEAANTRVSTNLASAHHQGRAKMPGNINPDELSNFAFELSIAFPNLLFHVSEGIWFTHQFWPLGKGKTLWEGRYYCAENTKNSDFFASEYAHIVGRAAWLEDTGTMENTYQAMLSGAKDKQWLMDEEVLIRHQLAVIEKLAG